MNSCCFQLCNCQQFGEVENKLHFSIAKETSLLVLYNSVCHIVIIKTSWSNVWNTPFPKITCSIYKKYGFLFKYESEQLEKNVKRSLKMTKICPPPPYS